MPRSYNFLPKRQGAVELFWGKGFLRKGKGAHCGQRGREGARLRPRMRADTAVGRRAEDTEKCQGLLWAQKRSTLHWPSQRAATGDAGRCDGRCTALPHFAQNTASQRAAPKAVLHSHFPCPTNPHKTHKAWHQQVPRLISSQGFHPVSNLLCTQRAVTNSTHKDHTHCQSPHLA